MRFDDTYRAFAESIAVPVVVTDPDGVVIVANAGAGALFGGLLGDAGIGFLGTRVSDHPWRAIGEDGLPLAPQDTPGARARLGGQPVADQVVGYVVDGRPPRWLLTSSHPFPREDDPGRADVVSTFVDITARRELEVRLEQRAAHDPLTGLANRERYEERLAAAAERAAGGGEPVALLVLDVDDFKLCNDLHGHAVGDAVLVEVADRIRGLVRASDTVARLGGDEFAVVLEGVSAARAGELARTVLAQVGRPVHAARGVELEVSVSIGVAVWPDGDGDVAALQLAADDAVYAAKHAGKGTVAFHDPAAVRPVGPVVAVRAEDAHAWAAFLRSLRAEIGVRKTEGALPAASAAPESVHRVLQDLLHRVDLLPPSGEVVVELPHERDLGPFVFHHASVLLWVAQLRRRGILTVRSDASTDRFWTAVTGAVSGGSATTRGPASVARWPRRAARPRGG